eukprot:m.297162 g.297162  ORF g.297162 m.297162 type:complete len:70 (-) comp27196_c0_seq2:550-759(-)
MHWTGVTMLIESKTPERNDMIAPTGATSPPAPTADGAIVSQRRVDNRLQQVTVTSAPHACHTAQCPRPQ